MRKVGIITLYDPENYGNRLQAYAMAKTLQNLDCQAVETYQCNGFVSRVKGTIKTNRFLRSVLELFWCFTTPDKGGIQNYRRVRLFLDFIKRTRVKAIPSSDPAIDYFVCGSDQIWNPDLGGTAYYFANFAPRKKRIAYAASFGVGTLPENVTANYSAYLKDMAHISVREHAGAAFVQKLAQREVPVVVDPTLLLTRDEWCAMGRKPKFLVKDRYLLTYFLGWHTEDIDNYIEKIAQEYDLQIISLNNMKKDQYWYGSGPAEFLWLIENASLVCTNSFHATVFSIIMNTPFVNFTREGKTVNMNSRIDTLLKTTQLSDRVYDRVNEDCLFDVDFRHVPEILEQEKKRSVAFFKNALNLDTVKD